MLKLVEARYRNGVATSLDVSKQTTAALQLRAVLIPLEVTDRQTTSALAVLIGRVPQGFTVGSEDLARSICRRSRPRRKDHHHRPR